MTNDSSPRRTRIAVYPGSFDLLTNGHLDLITRSQKLFDRVIVAVGVNIQKRSLFTVEERLAILQRVTGQWDNVAVEPLEGLTVKFAEARGAQFLIRGLRAISDFEFELQLSIANSQMNPEIETLFLAAAPKNIFLSSRMLKDIWYNGGDISDFVPRAVLEALEGKRRDLGLASELRD